MYLYFDASALIKRYVAEPGRAVVNELFYLVPFERLYLNYWTVTEMVSVLVRKRNRGDLTSHDMSVALDWLLTETTSMQEEPVDRDTARSSIEYILRHNVNATDALHLLVALRIDDSVDEPVAMVSADSRLLRASKAEGLTVLDPENSSPPAVRRLLQPPDNSQS